MGAAEKKKISSDSDSDVLWSVHYFRRRGLYLLMTSDMFDSRKWVHVFVCGCVCVCVRVCGGGFVLPFSLSSELFLSAKLQMLSSAHLGWDWAVRCEWDPRQQDLNGSKALPCVTFLRVAAFWREATIVSKVVTRLCTISPALLCCLTGLQKLKWDSFVFVL